MRNWVIESRVNGQRVCAATHTDWSSSPYRSDVLRFATKTEAIVFLSENRDCHGMSDATVRYIPEYPS